MSKEALSKAGLEKGLKALTAAAQAPDSTRATELFNKAQDGSISSEEKDELVKSLQNGLSGKVTEGLVGNEAINKSINVSDYLKEQHSGVVHGLETVADHITKSESRDQEFRIALATTLFHTGELLKAQTARADAMEGLLKGISDRLGIIAAQPARGPKSVAAPQAVAQSEGMNKSFAGGSSAGEGLSKSDVLGTMSDMIQKAGMEVVAGENLVLSAIKYESLNQISPEMIREVQKFRKSNKAA